MLSIATTPKNMAAKRDRHVAFDEVDVDDKRRKSEHYAVEEGDTKMQRSKDYIITRALCV